MLQSVKEKAVRAPSLEQYTMELIDLGLRQYKCLSGKEAVCARAFWVGQSRDPKNVSLVILQRPEMKRSQGLQ